MDCWYDWIYWQVNQFFWGFSIFLWCLEPLLWFQTSLCPWWVATTWGICILFSSVMFYLLFQKHGWVSPFYVSPLCFLGQEDKAKLILNFLFLAGFNTLCQTLCGTRLPIVMGSSYSYLVPVIAIAHRFSMEEPHLVGPFHFHFLYPY